MTELDEAAAISRDGGDSMRGIDPIHFPQRVGEFDHDRIVAAVREILIGIGEDPDRQGLRETPERVARAYAEMFGGLRQDPEKVLATVFDLGHDELVLVKDIEVWSCCEHHLVPFTGVAHVGYIPKPRGQDHRAQQDRSAGRSLRQTAPGAGATDHSDRRRHQPHPGAARGHRGDRVRASLHDHARRPQAGFEDDHQRRTRPAAQRCHPRRGDGPDHQLTSPELSRAVALLFLTTRQFLLDRSSAGLPGIAAAEIGRVQTAVEPANLSRATAMVRLSTGRRVLVPCVGCARS